MALRREDFTEEQLREVEACEASAEQMRRDLSDQAMLDLISKAANEITSRPRAPRITSAEFLEQTRDPEG